MSAPGPASLVVLDRFLIAAHAARLIVAGLAIQVAWSTTGEFPVHAPVGKALSVVAFTWVLLVALFGRPLDRLLRRHPGLVFIDTAVLVGLMLADKPWDSLVAVPYGSFLLAVAYARPWALAIAFITTAVLEYAPRLALQAGGWRRADLVPPVGTGQWLTAYVGPLFAGVICWALCVLLAGVRDASAGWQAAQDALTEAHARQAEAASRLRLADRIHETISQAVRAIPLRLDGRPDEDLSADARRIRAQVAEAALTLRPKTQRIARELREALADEALPAHGQAKPDSAPRAGR